MVDAQRDQPTHEGGRGSGGGGGTGATSERLKFRDVIEQNKGDTAGNCDLTTEQGNNVVTYLGGAVA